MGARAASPARNQAVDRRAAGPTGEAPGEAGLVRPLVSRAGSGAAGRDAPLRAPDPGGPGLHRPTRRGRHPFRDVPEI
jgi:hypothetical protein